MSRNFIFWTIAILAIPHCLIKGCFGVEAIASLREGEKEEETHSENRAGPDFQSDKCQTTSSNNNVCIFGSDSGNGGHGCAECCKKNFSNSNGGHCTWFTCWCEQK